MIVECQTKNIINITRDCIRGLDPVQTDLVYGLLIVIGSVVLFFVILYLRVIYENKFNRR